MNVATCKIFLLRTYNYYLYHFFLFFFFFVSEIMWKEDVDN